MLRMKHIWIPFCYGVLHKDRQPLYVGIIWLGHIQHISNVFPWWIITTFICSLQSRTVCILPPHVASISWLIFYCNTQTLENLLLIMPMSRLLIPCSRRNAHVPLSSSMSSIKGWRIRCLGRSSCERNNRCRTRPQTSYQSQMEQALPSYSAVCMSKKAYTRWMFMFYLLDSFKSHSSRQTHIRKFNSKKICSYDWKNQNTH